MSTVVSTLPSAILFLCSLETIYCAHIRNALNRNPEINYTDARTDDPRQRLEVARAALVGTIRALPVSDFILSHINPFTKWVL